MMALFFFSPSPPPPHSQQRHTEHYVTGILVQVERAPKPHFPEEPHGDGGGDADDGAELADEAGGEAAARARERVPAHEERRGLRLAGQLPQAQLRHQPRGAAAAGGHVHQNTPFLLRACHTQVLSKMGW